MAELSTLGAVIKTAYEGQPDTNAFTDAEKAKLGQTSVFTEPEKTKLAGLTQFSRAYSDLTGVPALDFIPTAQKAQANGVAPLDAAGFVPPQHLNISGLQFKGAWDPNTNTPTLVDGTGSVGDFYKASASGTFNFGNGAYNFNQGDWAIFAAGVWQRIGSSETVGSVNGKIGDVIISAADVGALPATYTPPAAPISSVNGKAGTVVLNAADVGALPSTYTPPVAPIPQLTYVNRFFVRVASTWYRNTSAYDRIVNISTNYVAASASSMINMRATGTTTPVFAARSQATGTGACNQVMQAIVPAGWEYQFAPGTSREVSTWFEGDYA